MPAEPDDRARRARAAAFRDPRTDPDAARQIERICRKYNIKLVVIFGSQATGRTHANSDVDIAVLPASPLGDAELRVCGELCVILASDQVDVSFGPHLPALLARNIAITGVPIFASSPDEWVGFRIRAFKAWDDGARTERHWRSTVARFLERRTEG